MTFPVTFPSIFAISVPVVTVIVPVLLASELVVPILNLSTDLSHNIAALASALVPSPPVSIINPESFGLLLTPSPRFNPIILSETSKLV